MSKNLKELEQEEEELSRAVRSSAQQIWQAGLGAFAKAQAEGGREFTRLVRDGSELQKRASRRASGSWGKLEQVFEERVARGLATIGVPARSEMEALNRRIDELERMVAELSSARARPAAKKGAPRKPATKRARTQPAAQPAAQAAAEDGGQ
jgi:polyhydroxyalkanoate synthesis regulator phasin